jgi:hypothetical protein
MMSLVVYVVTTIADPTACRAEEPAAHDLVQTVISAIDTNYAQLTSSKAVLTITIDRPTIKAVEHHKHEFKGGYDEWTLEPRSELKSIVLAQRNDVRADLLKTQDNSIDMTTNIVDGVVTKYSPTGKSAWIQPSAAFTDMCDIDPRNIGIYRPFGSYSDFLRNCHILQAEMRHSPEGATQIAVKVRHSPSNWLVSFTFDTSHNCLPSLIVVHYDDGSINAVTRLQYQEVLPNIWFLKNAVCHAFPQKATTSIDGQNWTTNKVTTVVALDSLNQPIDKDALEVKLPDGTHVHDAVARRSWTVGKTPGARGTLSREFAGGSFWTPIVWFNVGLLSSLLVIGWADGICGARVKWIYVTPWFSGYFSRRDIVYGTHVSNADRNISGGCRCRCLVDRGSRTPSTRVRGRHVLR